MSYNVSVRGDFIKVEIFSDNKIIFRGTAPTNNRKKVANLLKHLELKGVNIDGWF